MKLIDIFEGFFDPEIPGPRNKHHVRPGNIGKFNNKYPYASPDKDQRVSEDEIEQELEIDNGILSDDSGIDGGE